MKFKWVEKFKGTEEPWPWEKNPELWNQKLKRLLKLNFINVFVLTPFFVIGSQLSLGSNFLLSVEELPSFKTFWIQLFFMLIMDDFMFYWSHRLLHHKWLYPYIHKVHHESIETIALSAVGSHPIEHIISNFVSANLGIMLMPENSVHITTVMIFVSYLMFEGIDGHCGYEFPFSPCRMIPWGGSSNYHNYHHLENIGNYGNQFVLWDSIFGTNKEYYEVVE